MRKIVGICFIFLLLGFSWAGADTNAGDGEVLLKQAEKIARTICPEKNHPAVFSEIAAAYLVKKNSEKSEALFNEVFALMQTDEKTYRASFIYVIISLARAGKIDEALNFIKKDDERLNNAGVTYILKEGAGKLSKEKMIELSALVTDPKYKVSALGFIANELDRVGEKKEAEKYYDQILQLPAAVPDKYRDLAWCNAARALFAGGLWKQALELENSMQAPLYKAVLFSYFIGQTNSFVNPLQKRKKKKQLMEIIRAEDFTKFNPYALFNIPYQLAKTGNLNLALEFADMQKKERFKDHAYFQIVKALVADGNIKEGVQVASIISDEFLTAMSFIKLLVLQDSKKISFGVQKDVAAQMMRLAKKEVLCKACVNDQRKVFLQKGMFVLENTSPKTKTFKISFSYYRNKTKNHSQTYTLKPSEQVALTTTVIDYNNPLKEIEMK